MLYRLRQRTGDEGGFTLIELLVVILIIGILAAIAIPSFLSQKNKAYSSQAEEMARSMATAEETYATNNGGNYTNSLANLHEIEPTIPTVETTGGLKPIIAKGENQEYTVEVEVTKVTFEGSKPKFGIERTSTGTTAYKCSPSKIQVGCTTSGEW